MPDFTNAVQILSCVHIVYYIIQQLSLDNTPGHGGNLYALFLVYLLCFLSCGHSLWLLWLLSLQDVVIKVATGLAFFCGGIPLAVHADEWRFWMGQGSAEDNAMYEIPRIVSSTSATAVSGKKVSKI